MAASTTATTAAWRATCDRPGGMWAYAYAMTTPVARPPMWAQLSMWGSVKPSSRLMTMSAPIWLAPTPTRRAITKYAPNNPNTAPDAPSPAMLIGLRRYDAAPPPSPAARYSATNRGQPRARSSCGPTSQSAYMLNAMCNTPSWRNADVISRYHSWCCAIAAGISANRLVTSSLPCCTRNTTTLTASSAWLTRGVAPAAAPKTVRAGRTDRLPSATQVGHWNPTAAGRMQSGQIGRLQRVQLTPVSLLGCR